MNGASACYLIQQHALSHTPPRRSNTRGNGILPTLAEDDVRMYRFCSFSNSTDSQLLGYRDKTRRTKDESSDGLQIPTANESVVKGSSYYPGGGAD